MANEASERNHIVFYRTYSIPWHILIAANLLARNINGDTLGVKLASCSIDAPNRAIGLNDNALWHPNNPPTTMTQYCSSIINFAANLK